MPHGIRKSPAAAFDTSFHRWLRKSSLRPSRCCRIQNVHLTWIGLTPLPQMPLRMPWDHWDQVASGQVRCHCVKPGIQKHAHNPSLWMKPQHHPKVCSILVLPALPHTFLPLSGNRELLWMQHSNIPSVTQWGQFCVSSNLTFKRSQCWRNLPRTPELLCRVVMFIVLQFSTADSSTLGRETQTLPLNRTIMKYLHGAETKFWVCVSLIHTSGTYAALQQNLFWLCSIKMEQLRGISSHNAPQEMASISLQKNKLFLLCTII